MLARLGSSSRLDLLNKFQEEKCHLGLVTSNPSMNREELIKEAVMLTDMLITETG